MKRLLTLVCLAVATVVVGYGTELPGARDNFDFDWKFTLANPDNAQSASFDDSAWDDVQLPHDWSIYLTPERKNGGSMGFFPGGIGWYRKTFDMPAGYRDKRVYVEFDGVYHQSTVYVNGIEIGTRPYGYVGFQYDLTPHIKWGQKNTIAVKADHSDSPSSRWYSGSGIYRHVWLKVLNPVHVAHWGTYVTTPEVSADRAVVKTVTTIDNTADAAKQVTLESTIYDAAGKAVAKSSSKVSTIVGKTDVENNFTLTAPQLWGIDSPNMYTLVTEVKTGGKVVDIYKTPFGIREISYDSEKGFFLNGKHVLLKGVNLHQDAGALGTAVPDRSYERKLEILKEFGCNAIRCSHNPPSPELLDLCDRMGFVVIDEAFDKWKGNWPYAKYFDDWWQRDLDAMLYRDRNHPSIIMWSVGNEVSEQNYTTREGVERLTMLRDHTRKVDPTRKVTVAIAPANISTREYNQTGFNDSLDIVGYNYQEQFFEDDHKAYPNRLIYGSEVFPYYRGGKERTREYDDHNPWYAYTENDFPIGYFIWAGVDYLGESSGWPSRGWPTSPFDACMFEKPRAAFLRAAWSDKPMVSISVVDQSSDIDPGKDLWTWPHMVSHWSFPQYPQQLFHAQTITNCDQVELWVNETNMGRRNTADYKNNTIDWRIPSNPGTVTAKGFLKGEHVVTFELKTAGEPVKIELVADRDRIKADGQDLSHVTVRLVDASGFTVPLSDREIAFAVDGAGALTGVDNGDLRTPYSYKGSTMPTYFGKALAIVQSKRNAGKIILKATAKGLPDAIVEIISQ